ncbi:P-loop containing nucleoside triphosphate hydrolase protein [Podospora fimiseda]|uniref:P-loop containing nucleoside triphosphate hydrolase protein n=1 Tax=Podospora fimiseda TaxID=252190 RepID=A0AAN7BUE5_9PEZI|nr:P-loop containing nucleoside triphosphate hydrolase protein [Podospora fimiseda]
MASHGQRGSTRPLMRFPNFETFIERHKSATIAEFKEETRRITEFNQKAWKFRTAVLTAPSDEQPYQSHVLRVDLNVPDTEKFETGELRFVAGKKTSSWCSFRRGEEIIPLNNSWNKWTEIVVYVPPADVAKFRGSLVPLLRDASIVPEKLQNNGCIKFVEVEFHLEPSKVTMQTELQALDWLVRGIASESGSNVFSYLMEFKNPKNIVNFFDLYPQVKNLNAVPDATVRQGLKEVVGRFDQDQSKAHRALSSMPEGVAFVPGGPGAGKTSWALTIALMAQAGATPCKILYLVDINDAADDSADRMQALYNKIGLNKTAVRVPSWPGVDDEFLEDNDKGASMPKSLRKADFTQGFLSAETFFNEEGNENKALTLHQRAFQLYNSELYHTTEPAQYNEIVGALWKLNAKHGMKKDYQADIEALRKVLVPLYFHAIRDADFIATTPIAARRIRTVFRPDIVVFDECGHARELTTMTSMAFFRPKAFFFVGDHRQTEPYTEETRHMYAGQLKISTMERAEANGAAPNQLLVNHRAHGGLERLASGLFYQGRMRSDKRGNDQLFPRSVMYLRNWIKSLPGTMGDQRFKISGNMDGVPRLIIDHWGNTFRQAKDGTSSWSVAHHEFVMQQVIGLIQDTDFKQVGGSRAGTIMIISPYKAATQKYLQAIRESGLKKRRKQRILIRTVDTAQGQEADVVFLDLVRDHGTSHTDNSKRLCVSLTRARQAEIIMMSSEMVSARKGGVNTNVRSIWKLCESGEAGAIMHIQPRQADYKN